MSKVCSKCKIDKPLSDYYASRANRDGLQYICKSCQKEKNRLRDRSNDAAVKAAWAARNPEKMAYYTKAMGLRKHGMTVEQFDELYLRQGGVCAVCGNADSRRLCVDHDHSCCPSRFSCGKCIRGLLCQNCNVALGMVGDDRERLMKLVEYLDSNRVLTDMGLMS